MLRNGIKTTKSRKKKSRFDGIDVATCCSYIRSIYYGSKLVNIYDIDNEKDSIYVLKLTNVNSGIIADNFHLSRKEFLLLEVGVRFHPTNHFLGYSSSSHIVPSSFTMKLRKHIRDKRLEMIRQLGNLDRVIDMKFGVSESAYHIIVELYGQGNLILCDFKYQIIALVRTHQYDVSNMNQSVVQVKVGHTYPVKYATNMGKYIGVEKCSRASFNKLVNNQDINWECKELTLIKMRNGIDALKWITFNLKRIVKSNVEVLSPTKAKKEKITSSVLFHNLKLLLLRPSSGVFHYGPSLVEHCIIMTNLDPNLNLTLDNAQDLITFKQLELLINILIVEGRHIIKRLDRGKEKGYIFFIPREYYKTVNKMYLHEKSNVEFTKEEFNKVLLEFQPHFLIQHKKTPHVKYPNFAYAVDEFYSYNNLQKNTLKTKSLECSNKQRFDKLTLDQQRRVTELEIQMSLLYYQASLIESNAEYVDSAIQVIKSAIVSGIDWNILHTLLKVEQSNGNPIALLIYDLVLEDNVIILNLGIELICNITPHLNIPCCIDITDMGKVKISLDHGAHGNAKNMFRQYHVCKEKLRKTKDAHKIVLKTAKESSLKKVQNFNNLRVKSLASASQHKRAIQWFEKFRWFITTEGYLVLAGRDAHQNDLLVKRYLRSGDLYLHADVYGAASCIIRAKRYRTSEKRIKCYKNLYDNADTTLNRNLTNSNHISNHAIIEASHFTVCLSSAWKTGTITSAWWVESHQVSKITPTGEYLGVGGFIIRGRKNYLPPGNLEMGLAVMFRLGDEESIQRHESDFSSTSTTIESKIYLGCCRNSKNMNYNTRVERKVEESSTELSSPHGGYTLFKNESLMKSNNFVNNTCINTICNCESPPYAFFSGSNQLHFPKDESRTKNGSNMEAIEITNRKEKPTKKYGSFEPKKKKLLSDQNSDQTGLSAFGKIDRNCNHSSVKKAHLSTRVKNTNERRTTMIHFKKNDSSSSITFPDSQENRNIQNNNLMDLDMEDSRRKYSSSNDHLICAETTALLLKSPHSVISKLPNEVRTILSNCVTKLIDNKVKNHWDEFDAQVLENLLNLSSVDAQLVVVNRLYDLFEKNDTTQNFNLSASLSGLIRNIKRYGHIEFSKSLEIKPHPDTSLLKLPSIKDGVTASINELVDHNFHLSESSIIDGNRCYVNELSIDDTTELGKLTGNPLPEDLLLYAIPVCAPYLSLANYRYKLKLIPGSQRRGKASKQCVNFFLKSGKLHNSENLDTRVDPNSNIQSLNLIRYVNDNEWVQTILGDVNISAPGISKLKKKIK